MLKDWFKINYDKAYRIYYKYKSNEKFINKYKRDYQHWFGSDFLPLRIKEYFTDNSITLEKYDYWEKELIYNCEEFFLTTFKYLYDFFIINKQIYYSKGNIRFNYYNFIYKIIIKYNFFFSIIHLYIPS